jgi:hypothetical protein
MWITPDVTVTAGLDGANGTAAQFWIGYTPQPGSVDTNPGAGTSHIDFYNGDLLAIRLKLRERRRSNHRLQRLESVEAAHL